MPNRTTLKCVLVCGARPNFVKVAPLLRAMAVHNAVDEARQIEPVLVHTGQHYDYLMSEVFFEELRLPKPNVFLGVGSGTHAEQTARVMVEMERVLTEERPDLVVVFGDVNSTMAAALAAVKLCIPVAHVEAGLRSFDRTMPEEINRVVTDAISDMLFTPSADADENLLREGVARSRIHCVGNVMIDSLMYHRSQAEDSPILDRLGLDAGTYAVATLHRPSNVDESSALHSVVEILRAVASRLPVVFPVHPRTNKRLNDLNLRKSLDDHRVLMQDPVGYIEFLKLLLCARLVITDSGGVQEEATFLGLPCLTLRENTERPVTVVFGTNTLVPLTCDAVLDVVECILGGRYRSGAVPPLWDGNAAPRVIDVIASLGLGVE